MTNPFCHIELSTDDTKAAKAFYKKMFDWKFQDTPMGGPVPYIMIQTGQKDVGGGIGPKNMPGQPTAWLAYVTVPSVKKAIAKAEKLGAQVFVPYQSIGAMGAIGVFADPTGGAIGVWEPGAPAPKKAAKKGAKKAAKKAAKKVAKKK
jgi:uncharacterized protein